MNKKSQKLLIMLMAISLLIFVNIFMTGCKQSSDSSGDEEGAPIIVSMTINDGDATSDDTRNVTINLSASDDVGVTGYYLSQTDSMPLATDSSWDTISSTTFFTDDIAFSLIGSNELKTVYGWFKDAEGNISEKASDSIYLNIESPSDTSVTINNGDATTDSATVTLSLTASDNIGVTGYYVSEVSTDPSADASGWESVTSGTSFLGNIFYNSGRDLWETITVHAWFKDAIGEVSTGVSDTIYLQPSGLTWTVSDTGQTTSYTDTFGEDADYTINSPSFTDNGNDTITDNNTGLIWQKEDDDSIYTWSNAVDYCDNLTLGSASDWRLPSKRELMSIVNYGTYSPTIDTVYFPNTNSSRYWSSTTYPDGTVSAWYLNFGYGYVLSGYKTYSYYVRCVRGGQ